ncbi:MAG TPA: SRPBCC family protein [Anaerolineae bacterium]|nr:SRPBCC family protein [Anaerolineae bacterium]
MNTFEVTTFINRPVQEVFDFMINPANAARWQSATESAKWSSDGPVGVGSVLQTVGRFLGRELALDAEITQWNPPSMWGQKASNGPLKFENTNRYESKDGGTLLIQKFQGEIGGFFKMAEGLAVKQMQKQIEADGKTLKTLLETK